MDQDTKFDLFAFQENPRDVMRAFIGRHPGMHMQNIPDTDCTLDEIVASGIFDGLESREAYLAWVASYKELVNAAAEYIKLQKRKRRSPVDNIRSRAQEEASYIGECVTAVIRMRRLGKRWSAARATAIRAAA